MNQEFVIEDLNECPPQIFTQTTTTLFLITKCNPNQPSCHCLNASIKKLTSFADGTCTISIKVYDQFLTRAQFLLPRLI
jgi:hypothetical protein